MSKKSKKGRTPSISSAAGLVRFYEEADLKVALKPHLIILIGVLFVILVIVLSKVYPPPV